MGSAKKNSTTHPNAVRQRGSKHNNGASCMPSPWWFSSFWEAGLKKARAGIGMRYAILSRDESMSTPTKIRCPVSADPRAIYHLLQEPPNGGTPIMLNYPMRKAAMVKGI